MRPAERRQAIERELEITGRVDVAALANALSVSPISIRRDLNDLVDRGVARRVYGGAIGVKQPTHPRPTLVRRPSASRNSMGVIGLVVPSSRYYYLGVLQGVKAAAAGARVQVTLAVSGYSVDQELSQIERLLARGVTGLVVTPAEIPERDDRTYALLAGLDIPVVLMERDGGDRFAALDSVRSDHEFGARLAFGRLADAGHRAVALVCAEHTATAGWLRAGFEDKRHLFDPGCTEQMLIPSAPEYAPELLTRIDEVLDRFCELGITGALVHSDVAAGVLSQRARERGVPELEHLEVIAYDDEVAGLADPPLDAIAPRKSEVGRLALELVLERSQASDDDLVPRHINVPPALVLRNTEGALTVPSSAL